MPGIFRNIFQKSKKAGAVAPTNWIVLVQSVGFGETEFIEIRQNECAVWTARGKPFTTGHTELKEFQSTVEARAFLDQSISDNQIHGFVLLHAGCSIPGKLDFDLLEEAVYNGAKEAYLQICKENSDKNLTGFALLTDYDGMTICPAAMEETTFDDSDEDAQYYRTSPSEWPYTTDAGLLLAYRIILVAAHERAHIPFEAETPRYFDRFFESCTKALERLDREGQFGSGERRENFLLLFGVSDGGPAKATVRRLNPASVYERYEHCFD